MHRQPGPQQSLQAQGQGSLADGRRKNVHYACPDQLAGRRDIRVLKRNDQRWTLRLGGEPPQNRLGVARIGSDNHGPQSGNRSARPYRAQTYELHLREQSRD